MRFLLDQGVARSVAGKLRDAGHDAEHVCQCNLTTADDAAILAHARDHNRIVVTFDADFSSLMALSGASTPSIIHIRQEGVDAARQAALLVQLADAYSGALASGVILSVREHVVRRKDLPIR